MHSDMDETNHHSTNPTTDEDLHTLRDAEPPYRYLEMLIAADALGCGTAAILALRTPGLHGVLKFMAARGDSLYEAAQVLNLTYSQIQQTLEAEPEALELER